MNNIKLNYRVAFTIVILIIYSSCKNKSNNEPVAPPVPQLEKVLSEKPAVETKAKSIPVTLTYHSLEINDSVIKSLKKTYSDSQLTIILALNRIEYNKLYRKRNIVIPDTFPNDADLRIYSPFPDSLPFIDSVKKLILFPYKIQAFGVYEKGKLIRWGPTSMGKKSTPTPLGLFYTNWKGKQIISTVNEEWILNWYFNIENDLGVSLHQYQLPGYPASHSCLRLRESDAEWFYYWADQWKLSRNGITILAYGTPIIIFGEYAYEKAAPWNKLIKNGDANNLSADTLAGEIHPFLPTILERQKLRDSIVH